MKITVISTFRNEESNLKELISQVEKFLYEYDYEFILVDDFSDDQSKEIILAAKLTNSRIKLLTLSNRFGPAPSVLAGFKYATGKYIVYLDSDLQDPPELIPSLIQYAIENDLDVVHTKRTNRLGENSIKMFITNIAYTVIKKISRLKLVENCGDFKLLSRRVVDHILLINERDPYMRGLVTWVGFKQSYYEYVRQQRYSGVSKFNVLSLNPVEEFFRGVTSFSQTPLYFISAAGIIFVALSIILTVILIALKIIGLPTSGWTFIAVLITMSFGINIFFMGTIAIYIARIHRQIIDRPIYIVDKYYD